MAGGRLGRGIHKVVLVVFYGVLYQASDFNLGLIFETGVEGVMVVDCRLGVESLGLRMWLDVAVGLGVWCSTVGPVGYERMCFS